MARFPRIVLPEYPHHVVQRGHNRRAVFTRTSDFERYLRSLGELKREFGVKVHAYCLMTNHVHLLLAPASAGALALLMKRLAGRETRRRNRLDERSGTLWEGRYKSSVVDQQAYLLACCRYIELNPVRAAMVESAESYRWSSCRARLGLESSDLLDLDPAFLAIGDTAIERAARYRDFLRDAIPADERTLIRDALRRGQLTGGAAFREHIATLVGRRIEARGPGRPKVCAAPSSRESAGK